MKNDKDFYDSYNEKKGNGFLIAFGIILGVIILILSIVDLIEGKVGWFIFCCVYITFLSIAIYVEKKGSKLSDDFVPTDKTKEQLMDEYAMRNKLNEQRQEQARKYLANAQAQEWLNKPKCPTCGSLNVEKISTGKKVFGGAMFGLFSSDVRNTMHCKNCGYKW